QDCGDGVFGRSLRSGVAADTDPLLARTQPEPSRFPLQCVSRLVEQFDSEGLVSGNAEVERTVRLYLRHPQQSSCSGRIARVQPDRSDRTIRKLIFRGVGIQAEDIPVRPLVQT